MADLELTVREMINQIQDEAGWANLTQDRLDLSLKWVNRGYREFISGRHPRYNYPHQWSFLVVQYELTTVADTAEYEMPSDFSGIHNTPVYKHSESTDFPLLHQISTDQYNRLLKSTDVESTGRADRYAIFPSTFTNTGTQRWSLKFYPTFDAEYTVIVPYRMRADALTDDAIYHMGGQDFTTVILYKALAQMEFEKNIPDGVWKRKADEEMELAIQVDQSAYSYAPHETMAADITAWRVNDFYLAGNSGIEI